jgi:alpha-galactosidase
MKALADYVHSLGLKIGLYSSPGPLTCGGCYGSWQHELQDARTYAAWGYDYLKYDWNPLDYYHVKEMHDALRTLDRDVVYSLSNSAPYGDAPQWMRYSNCWRTTGDIRDCRTCVGEWDMGWEIILEKQVGLEKYAGPGHWNDPDMLVVGWVGWGPSLHATKLTPAEQYTHISLWCLLASPLLIGCDLERLDTFTLNLLTNDEVLAVNQDALGQQGRRIATIGAIDVFRKDLEDGSAAFGFFNRGDLSHRVTAKLDRLGSPGLQRVRDLWRQRDLGDFTGDLSVEVAPHDVQLYRVAPLA